MAHGLAVGTACTMWQGLGGGCSRSGSIGLLVMRMESSKQRSPRHPPYVVGGGHHRPRRWCCRGCPRTAQVVWWSLGRPAMDTGLAGESVDLAPRGRVSPGPGPGCWRVHTDAPSRGPVILLIWCKRVRALASRCLAAGGEDPHRSPDGSGGARCGSRWTGCCGDRDRAAGGPGRWLCRGGAGPVRSARTPRRGPPAGRARRPAQGCARRVDRADASEVIAVGVPLGDRRAARR